MKRKKETKKRHYIIGQTAKIFLKRRLKRSYNFDYKLLKEYKNKGPFLILGNHIAPHDPILMGMFFPFPIYYFASEQIFNLGLLSKLLVYAVNPIKKKKSVNDMNAIRKARTIVNEGGSVAIYPEGNVTYSGQTNKFDPSIVKVVRLLKIPVILFVTNGLYFSNARWMIYPKKGKSKLFVKEVIYPEEYNKLTDERLYEKIYSGLFVNPYDQKDILFKGKKPAEGLERLLFMDLNTNKPFQTYAIDNVLKSRDSDFELEYLETGYVKDRLGNLQTLMDLNIQTIKSYLNFYKENDFFSFETNALVSKNFKKGKKQLGKQKIVLQKDKIIFIDKKNQEIVLDFQKMNALAIQGKKKIIIYYEDDTWLVEFDIRHSPYIYLLTFNFYKEGESIYDNTGIDVSQFGL